MGAAPPSRTLQPPRTPTLLTRLRAPLRRLANPMLPLPEPLRRAPGQGRGLWCPAGGGEGAPGRRCCLPPSSPPLPLLLLFFLLSVLRGAPGVPGSGTEAPPHGRVAPRGGGDNDSREVAPGGNLCSPGSLCASPGSPVHVCFGLVSLGSPGEAGAGERRVRQS